MFKLLKSTIGIGLAAALAMLAQNALADTTIRMWTFLDPAGQTGREKVLKKLIDGFEAENPGVKVQVEPQAWQQIADKFMASSQTGTAPDVVWIRHTRLAEVVQSGALANLDDLLLKKWTPEQRADIAGPMWEYGSKDGAHYQIMHSRFVIGAFYRADLFKAAGIDPATLTTWDKFIEAAQKLTVKDASGNVVRWGYIQSYPTDGANLPVMGNAVLEDQGNLFDKDGNAKWATPAGVKGLNLELDMIRKYHVSPDTVISMNDDDMYDQFNAGRAAMIHGGTARLPAAQAKLGAQNVGYLRVPSFSGKGYSPAEMGGWADAVWSGSPNIELAGKWVEYMSSPAADELWVKEAGMVPLRKSTLTKNAEFFAKPENAYLATAFEEMNSGWLQPGNAMGGFQDDMDRAAQDVFINGADPMQALKKSEDVYNNRRTN